MLQSRKKAKTVLRWQAPILLQTAENWVNKLRTKKGAAKEYSPWWIFVYSWHRLIEQWVSDFIAGKYKFDPMVTYHMENETIIIWDYRDSLIVKWLHKIITPLFKHIISPLCFHLQGPSGVKAAVKKIKKALEPAPGGECNQCIL